MSAVTTTLKTRTDLNKLCVYLSLRVYSPYLLLRVICTNPSSQLLMLSITFASATIKINTHGLENPPSLLKPL